MTEQLKPLDQWNAERSTRIRLLAKFPRLNGIGCPRCTAELMDADDALFDPLNGEPPHRRVVCSSCTFSGSRVA